MCSESAVDLVSQLVAKGWRVVAACNEAVRLYAEQYPDEAPKSAKQLRKKYYEAQQTDDKPKRETNKKSKKEEVPLQEAPIIEPEVYTAAKEKIAELEAKVEQLKKMNSTLTDYLTAYSNKYGDIDIEEINTTKHGSTNDNGECIIKREVAFAFISKEGNEIQRNAVTKANPDNKSMFKLLNAVKSRYLEHFPPSALPEEILNATGIE
jgi:hypothetical protein